MSRADVPPRSCLVVPATSERMLARAAGRGADEVVLDLEDAVPAAEKDEARGRALAAIALTDWPCAVSVRINAPGTRWCHEDLVALASAGPTLGSIVVPKVESVGDLAFAERLLTGAETAAGRAAPLGIQALIETPAGVVNVAAIAGGSPRVEALILGYADLAASVGRSDRTASPGELWRPVQETVLMAARAVGARAIDGPFLRLDDTAADAAARHARAMGFDGKWAIHPSQIELLNLVFQPTAEERAHAEAVLQALDAARAAGQGAARLDGEMIDEAHRARALAVLSRTEPWQ